MLTKARIVAELGSAICAFLAAVFWFRSAVPSPPMNYEGIGALREALNKAVHRNRWAAAFAGTAALLQAVSGMLL